MTKRKTPPDSYEFQYWPDVEKPDFGLLNTRDPVVQISKLLERNYICGVESLTGSQLKSLGPSLMLKKINIRTQQTLQKMLNRRSLHISLAHPVCRDVPIFGASLSVLKVFD